MIHEPNEVAQKIFEIISSDIANDLESNIYNGLYMLAMGNLRDFSLHEQAYHCAIEKIAATYLLPVTDVTITRRVFNHVRDRWQSNQVHFSS